MHVEVGEGKILLFETFSLFFLLFFTQATFRGACTPKNWDKIGTKYDILTICPLFQVIDLEFGAYSEYQNTATAKDSDWLL